MTTCVTPTRLELSNTDATTIQITVTPDPGDGTPVYLEVPGLGISVSAVTAGGVISDVFAPRYQDTNSLWDGTIQVDTNAPADIAVQIVETSAAQTVGLTISDADVTYCAPTGGGGGTGVTVQEQRYSKNLDIVAETIISGDASIMILGDSINNPGQANYMWNGYAKSWAPDYWRGLSFAISSGNGSQTGAQVNGADGINITGLSANNGPDPTMPGVVGTASSGFQVQPMLDGVRMTQIGDNSSFSGNYELVDINLIASGTDNGLNRWIGTKQSGPICWSTSSQHKTLLFTEQDTEVRAWWRYGDGASTVANQQYNLTTGWNTIFAPPVDASSSTGFSGPSQIIAFGSDGDVTSIAATLLQDTSVTGIRLAYMGGGGFKTENHRYGNQGPSVPGNNNRPGYYSDASAQAYMDLMETNIVLIQLGANDGNLTGFTDHIEAVIERYRGLRSGLKFVLVSQYDVTSTASRWAEQAEWSRNFAGSSGNEDVAFIDVRNANDDANGPYASWQAALLQDGVHPNDAGSTAFAKFMWDAIIQSGNPRGVTSVNGDAGPAVRLSDSYLMLIETPANGDYVIDARVATARTIKSIYAETDAGSCSVTLKNLSDSPASTIGFIFSSSGGAIDDTLSNEEIQENEKLGITIASVSSGISKLAIVVEYLE